MAQSTVHNRARAFERKGGRTEVGRLDHRRHVAARFGAEPHLVRAFGRVREPVGGGNRLALRKQRLGGGNAPAIRPKVVRAGHVVQMPRLRLEPKRAALDRARVAVAGVLVEHRMGGVRKARIHVGIALERRHGRQRLGAAHRVEHGVEERHVGDEEAATGIELCAGRLHAAHRSTVRRALDAQFRRIAHERVVNVDIGALLAEHLARVKQSGSVSTGTYATPAFGSHTVATANVRPSLSFGFHCADTSCAGK